MGKDKYILTDEEFSAQKAIYVDMFKRNLAIIKEIIPDFNFPEEKINQYITKERIAFQKVVREYNESVNENRIDFDSDMMPESYERCMPTFYDKSGTAEAKNNNKIMLDTIQAPTEAGDKLRKKFYIDSLNLFQNLDASKISADKTFEEKADYLIDNFDILERGFEFQKINFAKKSSIGIKFSEEQEKKIKKIEKKTVDIGGKCRALKSIISSDLFLAFPFEDLTTEQSVTLALSLQSHVASKGALPQEAEKYGEFINGIIFNMKEPDNDIYDSYNYTENDIIDTKIEVPELLNRLNDLYSRLNEISKTDNNANGDLYKFLNTLSSSIDQLSSVKGAFTPEEGACFSKATSDLFQYAFQTKDNGPMNDPNSTESKINNVKKEVCDLLSPNFTSKLLFESAVVKHNVVMGENENPEFYSKLGSMIDKVQKSGVSFEQITKTAEDLNISPAEFVKFACEDKIKWQPKKWDVERFRSNREKEILKDREDDVMKTFNIPNDFLTVIRNSQITSEEIYNLSFIKDKVSQEEKNAALNSYLSECREFSKTMPEKYAKALLEENLNYGELWELSLRQGITVEEYIKRMLGEEDKLDNEIKKVNDQLKANAKNPIETLMAETMINLKELSFAPGNRIEMEKCLARFVALRAIQNHEGIKKGESLEDEPERIVSLSKVLCNLDRFTKDVFENDTFRYLAKTYNTDELSQISRGTDAENMYKFCDELKELQKNNSLHTDCITCMDKIVKYSDFVMRNENYIPDQFTVTGGLFGKHPNPMRLSIGRTALVTLTIAKMMESDYDFEDILDPYKLTEVKKDIGNEVFEMTKHEENREAVVNMLLKGYKKTIDYTNKEFSKMNSLNPIDVVKLGNPSFLALGHLLKDFTQEIGRMKGDVPLTPNNEEKLKDLDNQGEIINKYVDGVSTAMKTLVSMKSEKDFSSKFILYNNTFVKNAYLNKSFVKTKQLAEKLNTKFSIAAAVENIEKPNDPSTAMAMSNRALQIAVEYANQVKRPLTLPFETNAQVRDKIAEDVFSGKFSDDLQIKVNNSNNHVLSTKYYDQFANLAIEPVNVK